MNWLFLAVAIALEVFGTTSMKFSEGFTRLLPSILIFVFYGLSFGALTLALRSIDIGVAYAVWSGVGTALIVVIGILWFKEPAGAIKLASVGLIILGVVGLSIVKGTH
ncbi:MAG: multidrug efflux SMR transporter [Candidatus Brocadiales bacterium]|nr:multidrug efflux SMR transporter [Candidatus Bathyanammoxibius sp.]